MKNNDILGKLEQFLIAPSTQIDGSEAILRAKLVSGLCLFLIAILAFGQLFHDLNPLRDRAIGVVFIILIVMYGLSRTRFSKLSTYILTLALLAGPIYSIHHGLPPIEAFMMPAIVVAGFLLTSRQLAVYYGLALLALASLTIVNPNIDLVYLKNPIGKVAFAGFVMYIFSVLRERAEAERQASQKLADTVFTVAKAGIFITGETGNFVECNQIGTQMLGYSRNELLSLSFTDITLPEDANASVDLFKNLLTGQQSAMSMDIRYLKKDGSYMWAHVTVQVIQPKTNTQEAKMLAMLIDIEGRKTAEAAEIEARKIAERANQAKSDFLSQMSHELRTPLNSIIGLSKALVSDTTIIRSSKESEYITAINSSGQHLLSLIGDILDLSKLDAGARSLEKEPFTILQLLEECRNTFLLACEDKGVSLNIDSQLEGAYPVLGDITALKQILYNLLSNAVKFTQQGSISLTAVPYVAEEIDPNPNLGIMFIVADTGKGINADAIGTLFDSFTQEDSSIVRSFGGSGLGLNIAQKLAKLMGGDISCNSIVGQGSIFEVIIYLEQLPISFEMLDFDNSDVFEVPPLKLLVVDDVPLNLMVAAALLKPKGHIIETAADGHKALEMASNNDYDAILMDVHMPDMDGIEATRQIRNCANKQRAAVPIVALSADVDVTQQALFIASGMDGAVGKPWTREALEKDLKRILKLG
jgi:PAS domain S-box-containing protein